MNPNKSKSWSLYLAFLSGIAALATHFYLTQHYYELHLGLSAGSAICNLNKTFNCDAVAASRFSTLLGAPLALWGFATQLILVLFTLIFGLGLSSDKSRIGRYTLYLSSFTALASIVMGTISMFALGTYCLFCMVAYGLSFLHLFAIWNLQEQSPLKGIQHDLTSALTDHRWVAICIASIIPITFFLNKVFVDQLGGSMMKDAAESSLMGWQSSNVVTFTDDGLVKGPAQAKMTIVEFADFLCPHCKHAAPSLKVFVDSHPDVRLVFKVFPLDGSCNASTEMPKGDGTRCLLAKTVVCANKLAQKGWEVYEDIFAAQETFYSPGLAAEKLKSVVEKHGIEPSKMEACRNSEETHKSVQDQSQEGLNAKIEGTPSIFVNGRFLSRGQMLPVLQRVYDTL